MTGSVQLFAYEIDTHDSSKINTILSGKGVKPSEMTQEQYFHQQANLQRDLISEHVMKPGVKQDVLPVFLAPEFFFKWQDGTPYSRATFFNCIEDYLKPLSKQFAPVLWVLGTVWWQEPDGALKHSWQKERLSGIDGLNQATELWDRWDGQSKRILDDTQDPFFQAGPQNGSAFNCGIEVCLDHLTLKDKQNVVKDYGVLRGKYLAANPSSGGGIDVHILTAAGMGLQNENIAAKSGGVIFRCDGGKGANPRSQSVKITRTGASAAAALRSWSPTLTPLTATYVGADADNRLAIYPPVQI
jgi:hypothetical protein